MRVPQLTALLTVSCALAASGCLRAHNYLDRQGPRYAGTFVTAETGPGLKLVTFNIRYALEVDRAIELLRTQPALRAADILALQEMDRGGVQRIAEDLGLAYVYYPAAVPAGRHQDFGDAVLVRGEILEDHKVILPHPSRFGGMQRIAVAASARVAGRPVRIYSTHLGTPKDVSPSARNDQAAAIADDASGVEGLILVAGDFNNRSGVATAFERAGFTWLTRDVGRTVSLFSWDHVFVRGYLGSSVRSGAVDSRGASDHRAVWVELPLEAAPPPVTELFSTALPVATRSTR